MRNYIVEMYKHIEYFDARSRHNRYSYVLI